ncbi:BRCT domain-containing protein At4g02110 [Ziziphus jujuba]|uniref:BRCT domain-containing protein At4g02110 n=1 Tax=Ziziphus jujuba TaxID=326968 RepID=A0A6P4ACH2_ZIZJJ|nr:BRCT domain-containing protein At4g02110 [Ziziphus jujuba]
MMETSPPLRTFQGVRFVLFGFDPINEEKVRYKLVDCDGVDAGQYSQNCTHLIVDKIVYDDPICVAARKDGKTVVTGLWVDHSYDIGMPVDATSVLYRPLKDLNGIPGAKNLIICLTGYQRQDRDDIMTMVALMGAQFSKPLVANKVTHLICYKFDGEKYELAKKLTKIKLVNHRWLEDCLRVWEILPEANYNKSGYELEMMEAEAKDSEDEAEDTSMKQSGLEYMQKSPCIVRTSVLEADKLPKLEGLASNVKPVPTVPNVPLNDDNAKDKLSVPVLENIFDQASNINNVNIPKTLSCQDAGGVEVAMSGELPDLHYRTPDGKNVRNDLTCNFGKAERSPPHSDGKFSAKSYSRNMPRRLEEMLTNGSGFSKVPLVGNKVSDELCSSSFTMEEAKDRTGFNCVEAPQKEISTDHGEESCGILPQKRMMDASYSSSKTHKISYEAKSWLTSPSASDRTLGVQQTSFADNLRGTINSHFQLSNSRRSPDAAANLIIAESSSAGGEIKKASSFAKLSSCDLPLSKSMSSKSEKDSKTPSSCQGFKMTSFSNVPDVIMGKATNMVGEMGGPHNPQQVVEGLVPGNKDAETENSSGPSDFNLIGNRNIVTKPQRKKSIAKRTLGSRPKLVSSRNQKCSIYSNKSIPQNDAAICSTVDKNEKSPCAKKLNVSSPTENGEALKDFVKKDPIASGGNIYETEFMDDDETEAPEERVEVLEKIFGEETAIANQLTNNTDTPMEEKFEGLQYMSSDRKANTHDDTMALKEDRKAAKPDDGVGGKISTPVDSNSIGYNAKKKKNTEKGSAVGKTKMKKVPNVVELKYMECTAGEETRNEKNEATEMETENRVSSPAGKPKSPTAPKNKSDNSIEMEKENKPIVNEKQRGSETKKHVEQLGGKSDMLPTKTNQNSAKLLPDSSRHVGDVQMRIKSEPSWFILSGHKFQRKEFQQVIRRLKGKCCRDSHQWSYQATHFIAPDPIRRTEKFFAAAASGRWILKTDYLAASSQEGRFLAEKPYEWYKNGLSEDGAINMEAPRKWRLLRERTGHGAFYGMRIIIYGECIAPPLDTLKRVVKAGDGTILATSPPYTRFLDSGVDFAIVSPGMPRVDMWVQEFLKHEIPCVVADYLVEYVCKSGYSLERHVLYNTHAWAEKSFAKIQSRAEEVVGDLIQRDKCDSNEDLPCKVCGSGDRGDVMLICGNEDGSLGCGTATHIDCCDPPFQEVPEDDWFCSQCKESKKSRTSTKRRKKGTSAHR